MEKKEMVLSLKMWGETMSIKKEHSETTEGEFMEMVEKIIFSSGFSRDNLEQYIIDWGKELENKNQ